MVRKLWKFLCILSIGPYGQQVQAKVELETDFKEGAENRELVSACKALLVLNKEQFLSLNEELVGRMAYEIVEQLSDSPLEYCSLMAANIKEHGPTEDKPSFL